MDVHKILEGFGVSKETLERIKLSRGVVGRTTYAVIAVFVVMAAIAYRMPPEHLWELAVLCVFVFALYFVGVMVFAHRNPGAALLEGAELLHWQQTELAAKNVGTLPKLPPIANPETPELPPANGGTV